MKSGILSREGSVLVRMIVQEASIRVAELACSQRHGGERGSHFHPLNTVSYSNLLVNFITVVLALNYSVINAPKL